MVVIKFATYTTRCPFSSIVIHPRNKICLFNTEQFEAFKRIMNEELVKFIPQDLITLIIQKTGYEKFIGRFGHANVSHWTVKYTSSVRKNAVPLQFGNDRAFNRYHHYDRGYTGWSAMDSIDFDRILDFGKKKDMDRFIVSENEERPNKKCKMILVSDDESDSDDERDEDSS